MLDQLKQLKNLRSQAKQLQQELADVQVTGTGADGKVTVTLDGNQNVQSVSIDPSLMQPDDREVLERGVQQAFEDGMVQLRSLMAQKMSAGGLNLPSV